MNYCFYLLCFFAHSCLAFELPDVHYKLPVDYIQKSVEDGYLLSSEQVLDKYIREEALIGPVIKITSSKNVAQTGKNSFSGEQNIEKMLKRIGFIKIKTKRFSWGAYPVFSIEAEHPISGKYLRAWAGLNQRNKNVLSYQFLFPKGKNRPNSNELAIWDSFLKDTF